MLLKERRDIVKESGCCFNCLRKGHNYKRCRANVKCAWCGKRHVLLMCPENIKSETRDNSVEVKKPPSSEHNLASYVNMPEAYMQTLRVVVYNEQCTISALVDTN